MNCDYHMHTPRCKHALGSMREYAAAALFHGLPSIGISDHSPMPEFYDPDWRMAVDELDNYVQDVRKIQHYYAGRLQIKLGLEADFYPETENWVKNMLAKHDWDYVIGSVHFIGNWGFDNPDERDGWLNADINKVWQQYYALVATSAESGLFDIIAHPDLPKKFGHRAPNVAIVNTAKETMLQAIADSGCALEINSAGLRKEVNEIYPHASMIVRAAELGIPFVFGSDAHNPGEVAYAIKLCKAILLQCGVTHTIDFTKRKAKRIKLT
ncbi:MAG: histidinol-phosphatase HisJ family protein [Mariprofundales bacterium]